MVFKGEKGYSPLYDETVFYSNLIPFSLPGCPGQIPGGRTDQDASSGAIQGKAILMKAENAELADSKLERIHSNKFIAGMAKKDSGASWKINVPNDGEYILEIWYVFPWTASASAQYELQSGSAPSFVWKVPTNGGGINDGSIYHPGSMKLTKGKQTFTIRKKEGTASMSATSA